MSIVMQIAEGEKAVYESVNSELHCLRMCDLLRIEGLVEADVIRCSRHSTTQPQLCIHEMCIQQFRGT